MTGLTMLVTSALAARAKFRVEGSPVSVSYTHLDVYKRQVLHSLNGRIQAEVYLPQEALADPAALSHAEREFIRRLSPHPLLASLSINFRQRILPAGGE